ncbi:MAG: SDR family NAD(P)-dependent oxidoreductase [Phototrophicaceae bacterium]
MNISFKNTVTLVTGGANGIGKAVSQTFNTLGAQVAIFDRDETAATQTATELSKLGHVPLVIVGDVSNAADCRQAVDRVVEQFGRLDVLVNCAGISKPIPSVEMPIEDWDSIIAVDLNGVFYFSQAAARQMIKQKSGNIVSISSISAALGFPMRAPYCAAKAAVEALTRVLASEWAIHNIRVNAVAPGYIMTELVSKNVERGVVDLKSVEQRTPLGRLGQPEEIASVIAMIVSEYGAYITGETIYVDGGYTASAAAESSSHAY